MTTPFPVLIRLLLFFGHIDNDNHCNVCCFVECRERERKRQKRREEDERVESYFALIHIIGDHMAATTSSTRN